ncbi:MAG: glycosyltransferase [Deltaproteobacteria bacterium]|nr:glycosyltransferase [Deltaproteobacteria bacterium]
MDITLVIPVHNEAEILRRNAVALHDFLSSCPQLESFEIIFSCNGCTDGSEEICRELSRRYPRIRHIVIAGRGLGNAIRAAVEESSFEAVMFYAIDLPFGLSVIGDSIRASLDNGGAVVIGSKGHPGSSVKRGLMRWLFSSIISTLNKLFFGLGVKDTQGSILFYRKPFKQWGRLMDSPGAFFQAQILIYSKIAGYRLVEIPVTLREVRKTRFRLAGDGIRYLKAICREKIKLLRSGIR